MSDKKPSQAEKLLRMRHTAEHVLHQATKELYPSIHLAMGPATEEGYYFDFDASPDGGVEVKISEEDFPKIEKRMQEIIDADMPVTRHEITVEEARVLFADNPYKQDWINIIEEKGEKVSVYWTGEPAEGWLTDGIYASGKMNTDGTREMGSMVDLCRGPHVVSTKEIKAFKLLSTAGAYWHGDEKNKMLSRIYGTAFFNKKELRVYMNMLVEAKKRDHKKLGVELDLFTFSNLVGAGLPLWTPKGTLMRNILDDFVWELRKSKGYEKVEIPHITKKDLYEKSGHWEKFGDELFRINTREGHEFVMKPMNCPHHTQIFARKPVSYREMPQRYANTTMVYRDEQTGELAGLSRVRSITQDDAHVFCRKEQVKQEMMNIWDIIDTFYGAVGFDLSVRLSLSDPAEPDKYLGSREDWENAENELRELARERGVKIVEAVGEAAFYGPKLDFIAKDSLGREWQVATNQLDMQMPERFNLFCINEKGEKERIVMIHAAIMGSIERYISILIEHFAGKFPTWLAPVQVKLLPIADRHHDYAYSVKESLEKAGIRVEMDDRSERLPSKIRDAQLQQVPYMLVMGDAEVEGELVAVRKREGGKQEVVSSTEFVERIVGEVEGRGRK